MNTIAKSPSLRFGHIVVLFLVQSSVFGQSNFVVTPNLAFQTSFPSKESYQYQVFASTNLASWFPAAPIQVSTGGVQTLTFPMSNTHEYYRVQETLPNFTNRIVGLTNIYFDNAFFTTTGATGTISGFRAISAAYGLNDYIQSAFSFDLAQQTISLNHILVSTNLGPDCDQTAYFINGTNSAVLLTNGASVLAADTSQTITSTGQVMNFNLKPGQVLTVNITALNYTNQLIFNGPNGLAETNTFFPLSVGNYYYQILKSAIFPGAYTLKFVPKGVASESVSFSFHNRNSHTLVTLTNNMNLSTSVTPYDYDYSKFQVHLNAGQILTLGATDNNGATLALYNSLGVRLLSSSAIPLIYSAPTAGTYYVIYFQDDLQAHAYSTTVSISP
jgi:hypothetical protein